MLLALALGCSFSTTGCLVADAPNYGPPEQRPPVINAQEVIPTPFALIVVASATAPAIPITVPVRSEDAGEPLTGLLYVDYGLEKQWFWDQDPIPPGSFDELDRSYNTTFQLDSRVTPGCHTLTVFITHESNFDGEKDIIIDSRNFDVASVTWWMNVMPADPTAPGTLEGCPTVTGP